VSTADTRLSVPLSRDNRARALRNFRIYSVFEQKPTETDQCGGLQRSRQPRSRTSRRKVS
jgi:hypothetical protein